MNEEITITCPYCGEALLIEPEPSDDVVQYVEDCHVCCRPILLTIHYSEDGSTVTAERENG